MSRTFARARGSLTVLRALPGQRGAHYRPPEWLQAERDRRVRALVRHAADHVTYYQEFFKRERIDPRELRTAGDLAALPLVDKHAIHRDPGAFRSTAFADGDVLLMRTNGSTGRPVDVYHDRHGLLETIAHSERDRAVESAFCSSRYRYRVVEVRNVLQSAVGDIQAFYGRSSFRPLRPRVEPVMLDLPIDDVLERVASTRPEVLRGYGSYLEAFFRAVEARGSRLATPKVVVYYGDVMSPAGRRLIEERFGIPVVSRYGAAEALRIGFTCERRDGFHLHEDLCHVRLLDDDGREADEGEVVISNLVNRGTVLLNYRLGDRARLDRSPCACGRTTVRVAEVLGRVADVIPLRDRLVHQFTLGDTVGQFDELFSYQLAQLAPSQFELRLATEDELTYARVAPAVVEQVRRHLPGCEVVPAFRPGLVADANGKVRRIVPLPP